MDINNTRPADPKDISFAPECFEIVGQKTVWRIKTGCLSAGSTWEGEYFTEEEARKEARGKEIKKETADIKRRIRWN